MFFGKKKAKNATDTQPQQEDKAVEIKEEQPKKEKAVHINREESINFKCEQFFGKNWKYVAGFIGICFLIFSIEIRNMSEAMQELKKVVYDNNDKVVLTTTDGRAIRVTKEPLRAEFLKQYAISAFSNNFIVSRSQLTDNFTLNSFKNYEDVIKNAKGLAFIFETFFESGDKVATGDFVAYLQWLLSAMAQDKLPEYISLKDYVLDNYEYNENKFKMELSLKVVANSYILARGKYEPQNGTFKIYIEGSYNLEKSSDTNPYGLRVQRLKVSPVVKSGV